MEVLIGNDSLHLQDLVAPCLVSPGMEVLTEQPSYDRAITTFRRRGARVIGIPLEHDGIIARLETTLLREVPVFVYLVSDFQHPAGVIPSLEKRRKVVELGGTPSGSSRMCRTASCATEVMTRRYCVRSTRQASSPSARSADTFRPCC